MSTNANIIENVGNAPNVPITNHSSRISSIHATGKATINSFNGPNSTSLSDDEYAAALDGITIENGAQCTFNSFNGNVGVGNTYSNNSGTSGSPSAPMIPVWMGMERGMEWMRMDHGDWHQAHTNRGGSDNTSRHTRTTSTSRFTRRRVVNYYGTTTSISTSHFPQDDFDEALSDFISTTIEQARASASGTNNPVVVEYDSSSIAVSESSCEEIFMDADDTSRSGSFDQKSQKKGRRYRAWWLRKGLRVFEGIKKGLTGLCKVAC